MSYGEGEGERRQHLLLRLVTIYVTDFQESIQGTSKSMHTIPTDDLMGGARLLYIFNNEYGMTVGHMTAADDLSLEQVRTAIRNSSVPHLILTLSDYNRDRDRRSLCQKDLLRC